jgi:hypothetical protein
MEMSYLDLVALGGVEEVIVLATGPEGHGFKPERTMYFKGDKNPQHIFLRMGSKAGADFYRPEKSIALAAFEPASVGSSGKHTNHYTAEAT